MPQTANAGRVSAEIENQKSTHLRFANKSPANFAGQPVLGENDGGASISRDARQPEVRV